MKRFPLLTLALLLALSAVSIAAAAPASHGQKPTKLVRPSSLTPGFFQGRSVRYFDFGPIKLAPGNKLAPIWVVKNGAKGQRNVIDTVPGRKDYSPLWAVVEVTWHDGVAPRVLRSAAAVKAAEEAGEVTLRKTATVVNCPVVGFGQKEVLGFAKGKTIAYYDLGPVKLNPGNKVAPIWVLTNGVPEQHNVIDTLPGDRDYTPLWKVSKVTFADGVAPRLLTSVSRRLSSSSPWSSCRIATSRSVIDVESSATATVCPSR